MRIIRWGKWWIRWWVRYFPRLSYNRITTCRREHHGPMYDGWVCLHCGAPWFAKQLKDAN